MCVIYTIPLKFPTRFKKKSQAKCFDIKIQLIFAVALIIMFVFFFFSLKTKWFPLWNCLPCSFSFPTIHCIVSVHKDTEICNPLHHNNSSVFSCLCRYAIEHKQNETEKKYSRQARMFGTKKGYLSRNWCYFGTLFWVCWCDSFILPSERYQLVKMSKSMTRAIHSSCLLRLIFIWTSLFSILEHFKNQTPGAINSVLVLINIFFNAIILLLRHYLYLSIWIELWKKKRFAKHCSADNNKDKCKKKSNNSLRYGWENLNHEPYNMSKSDSFAIFSDSLIGWKMSHLNNGQF